jgi:hypothetical protein
MCLSLQRITGVAPHAQQSCVTKNASSACEFQRGTTPVGRRTERNSKMISGDEVPQAGASIQGTGAGTRGLVLAHLSFIEDLDDGLEIDGRLVGQLIEPLRHGDQGGSRACVRGDASYSKTVGRGQAELFGSIRHVRTLRCANSTRSNWFRLINRALD